MKYANEFVGRSRHWTVFEPPATLWLLPKTRIHAVRPDALT
jgi:hypothetical protein